MRLAVLAAVAACNSPAPMHSVDAGLPLDYTVSVGFDTTRADMPSVFIDGVATMTVDGVYPMFDGAIQHQIELRYADQVLAHLSTSISPGDCGPPDATWTTIVDYVQALSSGDLRYEDGEWRGPSGACTADGFGLAHCFCQSTERCAPRVTRMQPLFTQMACTPIGPKAAGDPCTLTSDPAGAYDDCGDKLVCIAGTCTKFGDAAIPAEYPPETHTGP